MKTHLLAAAIAVLLPAAVVAAPTMTAAATPAVGTSASVVVPAKPASAVGVTGVVAPVVPAISDALGSASLAATDPANAVPQIGFALPALRHHRRIVNRATAAFDARQRAEVAEHIANNTQAPSNSRASGTSTSYRYQDGQIFIVYGGLERITSIDLEPGEEVTGPIQAGDTVRWMVATVTSGTGTTAQQHIIVKPTDAGAVTNMMIPTSRRVYMLDLRATEAWYMPSVRFTYPAEDWARANAANRQQQHTADMVTAVAATSPEALRFDYSMSGHDYRWKPLQVFDDGTHTYIRMPSNLASTDAPALFVIENGDPLLVNYRVKGTSDRDSAGATYIVDRLFDRAELRVGSRQTITIRRR
jgi:P-type conjugative transfer protein TrbG